MRCACPKLGAVLACMFANSYIPAMCGRVIQSSGALRYSIVDGMNVRDSRVHNYPPRWNAAPSQELLVIRRNHKTGEVTLDPLLWGLIPYWCKDPKGGRKPINAKRETVRDLPTFRDAYRKRRCIVPVDGFFEWKAVKGQRAKQPYAIAMKDGAPLDPVLESEQLPHIVVKTSPKKFHTYYLVDDIKLDHFEPLQRQLAERFGGDPSVHDLPRVMLLPGFAHRKHVHGISPVHIVATRTAPPYTAEDLDLEPAKSNGKSATKPDDRGPPPRDSYWYDRPWTPEVALNNRALENLGAWVPEIFPDARPYHGDGFRVSSADLGRDNEEDLSLTPGGIKDFGVHDLDDPLMGKRTPINLVLEHVFDMPPEKLARANNAQRREAMDWLRERLPQDDKKPKKKKKPNPFTNLTPYNFPNESTLERLDFLYGHHLLRATVSLSAGLGGTGKSSKAIVEALAMASGKPLLGIQPAGCLRVLLVNLEGTHKHMDLRIAAAMKLHRVRKKEVGGRLFVIAKRELKLAVAKFIKGDICTDDPAIAKLVDAQHRSAAQDPSRARERQWRYGCGGRGVRRHRRGGGLRRPSLAPQSQRQFRRDHDGQRAWRFRAHRCAALSRNPGDTAGDAGHQARCRARSAAILFPLLQRQDQLRSAVGAIELVRAAKRDPHQRRPHRCGDILEAACGRGLAHARGHHRDQDQGGRNQLARGLARRDVGRQGDRRGARARSRWPKGHHQGGAQEPAQIQGPEATSGQG